MTVTPPWGILFLSVPADLTLLFQCDELCGCHDIQIQYMPAALSQRHTENMRHHQLLKGNMGNMSVSEVVMKTLSL